MRLKPDRFRILGTVAFVGLTVACGSSNLATTNPFAEAHSVVQSWWPQDESAFISGDPSALTNLYSDSALDVASGEMTIESLRGSRPKYPRPYRSSTIFQPSSPGDQRWFLAIVAYAPVDQDGRAEPLTRTYPGLLFEQSAGSWKVVAADVQAPIPHSAEGGDQTLASPLADSHYIVAADAISPAYAAYLGKLATGAAPQVPFATGMTSFGYSFTRINWPPGSIATAQYKFEVDTPDLAKYSITAGFTPVPEVVLFVLRRTVTIKPRSGCLVRRSADIEWSDIVPPGSYSSVALVTIAVVAASVPLNDGDTSQGRKVVDISAGTDDVSANTVKC